MTKKDKKGDTYILLQAHPNQDKAEYIGFAEEKFESDEKAIKAYQNSFVNNGDSVVVKVVAVTRNILMKSTNN